MLTVRVPAVGARISHQIHTAIEGEHVVAGFSPRSTHLEKRTRLCERERGPNPATTCSHRHLTLSGQKSMRNAASELTEVDRVEAVTVERARWRKHTKNKLES
jgi:hypothetical protein